MRLLVAEDDVETANGLKTILEHSFYSVDVVNNGTDALDFITAGKYDGIILDVMMPGMSGFEVLKSLRKQGIASPVLILSAKDSLDDRVSGLDLGADDYLPKPFAAIELLARVRAMTRRSGHFPEDVLTIGNITLNCTTYKLSSSHGSVRLNNKEFQLLEHFMRNPGKIFSTEMLMQHFWGWGSTAEISVVWSNITNLRRKLEKLDENVELHLLRGAGYYLEDHK